MTRPSCCYWVSSQHNNNKWRWRWTNIRLPIYSQNANLFPFMEPILCRVVHQSCSCIAQSGLPLIESLRATLGLCCLIDARGLWDINIYWIIKRRCSSVHHDSARKCLLFRGMGEDLEPPFHWPKPFKHFHICSQPKDHQPQI